MGGGENFDVSDDFRGGDDVGGWGAGGGGV